MNSLIGKNFRRKNDKSEWVGTVKNVKKLRQIGKPKNEGNTEIYVFTEWNFYKLNEIEII